MLLMPRSGVSVSAASGASGITSLSLELIADQGDDVLDDVSSLASSALLPAAGTNRLAVLYVMFATGAAGGSSYSATWGANNFTLAFSAMTTNNNRPCAGIFVMPEASFPSVAEPVTFISDVANIERGRVYLEILGNVNQAVPVGATGGFTNNFGTSALSRSATVSMSSLDSLMVSVGFNREGQAFTITSTGPSVATTFTHHFSGGSIARSMAGAREQAAALGNLTHTYTTAVNTSTAVAAAEILIA